MKLNYTIYSLAVAAFSIGMRVDQIFYQIYLALGITIANYTAQNFGARKILRVKEGAKISMIMVSIVSILSVIILTFFSDEIASVFMKSVNPEVVKYCKQKGYPIIPGVCTPTEVEAAMALGLTYLKFFPAEAAGGVKMIKAMAAPYTTIRFMPTGGISTSNLSDYLNCKAVFACGGSWMVPADLISGGRFDEIEKLTNEAVELLKEIRK